MNTVGNTGQTNRSSLFPVEWPLTINAVNKRQQIARNEIIPKIKRRKTEHHHLLTQMPKTNTERYRHRDYKPSVNEMGSSVSAASTDVPSIFNSLDHDEASWLVEEVNEANKRIFGVKKTAEKFRQDNEELEEKKVSLSALQGLLNDLRRNIKYPDEETAKDLETLDEVSSNFGVRNMVNCLGLLDNYFSDLQQQLDVQSPREDRR